jgi:Ca2+-transporting ATPase
VTVAATDKTGTLTEGRMTVEQLVTPTAAHTLTGEGYAPEGSVSDGYGDREDLLRLARDLVLCNDADLVRDTEGSWEPVGDPMEAALVAAAYRCGLDPEVRSRYSRWAEIPFDALRRRMTTVHTTLDGTTLVVCKGAPEAVLGDPALLRDARDRIAQFAAEADRLAHDGHRVLAVADSEQPTCPPVDQLEQGLRLVGLVALMDPLRQNAHAVARSFADAGIRLILITGDHPATAAAIAARLDLPGEVVHGDQLDADGIPLDVRVFARARPEQKLDIVRALQGHGPVVAMTGDGVNDAPALHRADIGVAMGRGGTEVARQAAALVLADDNLATVTAAVEEGRRIYANLRRFLRYALSGGLAEVLVMPVGPFAGLAVPLLPAQILWINMLTHGLPGVALGAEPADRDAMRAPPRAPDEAMLGAGPARRIALTGSMIAAVSLAAALWAYESGGPWQTVLFAVLGFAQLGVALAVRAERADGASRNPLLGVAVAVSLALQLAAVLAPPLHELLGTTWLSPTELLACASFAAVPGLLLYGARQVTGRRSPASGPSAAAAACPPARCWEQATRRTP